MRRSAWRIFKPRHAETAFTGEGARLYGGRWNSPGASMVYTAGSLSLAALELLAHLSAPQILDAYVACEVTFDDRLIASLDTSRLPKKWQSSPAPWEVRQLGDEWIARGDSAVLEVPSAIVPTERNYLLNPIHPDFQRIQIGDPVEFRFDPRFVKS